MEVSVSETAVDSGSVGRGQAFGTFAKAFFGSDNTGRIFIDTSSFKAVLDEDEMMKQTGHRAANDSTSAGKDLKTWTNMTCWHLI